MIRFVGHFTSGKVHELGDSPQNVGLDSLLPVVVGPIILRMSPPWGFIEGKSIMFSMIGAAYLSCDMYVYFSVFFLQNFMTCKSIIIYLFFSCFFAGPI
jgi:hypothetical protein